MSLHEFWSNDTLLDGGWILCNSLITIIVILAIRFLMNPDKDEYIKLMLPLSIFFIGVEIAITREKFIKKDL